MVWSNLHGVEEALPFPRWKDMFCLPGKANACALFPEYCFIMENQEFFLKKEIFRNFLCIQNPCFIPPQRREALQQLFRMSIKESFLSDFYLFGISPFVLDLKSLAGESLGGITISEEGRAHLPHHRIEEVVLKRLYEGGYLEDWESKIDRLDRSGGLNGLSRMKLWTDQMAMDNISFSIAYQFDGNRLLPIRLDEAFRPKGEP